MAVTNPLMLCRECGEVKPVDDFRKNAPSPNGHRQPCKLCLGAYNRAYYKANAEKAKSRTARWYAENYSTDYYLNSLREQILQRKYGITEAQYDAMLEEQDGGCAICGKTAEENGKLLAVDHDHRCCPGKRSCGKCVRGLLCEIHNRGLGFFGDDPKMLLKAVDYLEREWSPSQ